MTTVQSRKSRGRRLQQHVAKRIREIFDLSSNDVCSAPMGVSGMDVQLSDRARLCFPWAVEAKNQQRVNIWESWEQAKTNAEGLKPVLIVKRNRSDVLAVVDLEEFLRLVKENK